MKKTTWIAGLIALIGLAVVIVWAPGSWSHGSLADITRSSTSEAMMGQSDFGPGTMSSSGEETMPGAEMASDSMSGGMMGDMEGMGEMMAAMMQDPVHIDMMRQPGHRGMMREMVRMMGTALGGAGHTPHHS
jgi:hypothetical protein